MTSFQNIGVLLDLYGVIYQGRALIPGALVTIHRLKHNAVPFRFITNTTRMTKKNLAGKLRTMGFPITTNEVFAAPHATIEYCKNRKFSIFRRWS